MSAVEPLPTSSSKNIDLTPVAELAEKLNDQIILLRTLLEEGVQDPTVHQAVIDMSVDARHLWNAASLMAHAAGVHSAADLEARVDAAIAALEPVFVAIETLKGTLPEVIQDLSHSGTIESLAASTVEWMAVMQRARHLLQGASPSLASSLNNLLERIERWANELLVAWETVLGTAPHIIDTESFRLTLTKFTSSVKVWTGVAHEARTLLGNCGGGDPAAATKEIICAIRDAQQEIRDNPNKGGGLFSLLKLVLSGQTQYVLRYVITVAYRVLKTIDAPAASKS